MSDAHPGRGGDGSPDGGDPAAQPRARLADLGVAAYDGPRGGVAVAVAALATHTARRLLGLGRRPRAKLVPLAVLALAYIPAVAFLGVAVLVPEELSALLTLDVRTLLSTITVAVAVFVALTGPEALCPDRRHGTLTLYFASGLSPATYLLAKAAAVAAVLLAVTLGPALLLEAGSALVGLGPEGALASVARLGRVAAAGAVLAGVYTAVGLAAASLTDRHAVASGLVIAVLLGSNIGVGLLDAAVAAPAWLPLLSLVTAPLELVDRLLGTTGEVAGVATTRVVAANLGWLAVLGGLAWWRHDRVRPS